jgi:ubiquinone/menaquinone biosynthesis C-methylase UbiE
MEGPLAAWYGRITRNRPDIPERARGIAGQLAPGSAVLEIAPGPGYLAVELAKLGDFRITGVDISRSFVRMATENARRAGVEIDFELGDVAAMPLPSDFFDFAVCVAAFKNFPDPVAALNEIHRVLRPGGRASIFDMRKDATTDEIDREIRGMKLAGPSAFFTGLIFRHALLRAAYTREKLEAVVARSRFGRGDILMDGLGFELQLVKMVPNPAE